MLQIIHTQYILRVAYVVKSAVFKFGDVINPISVYFSLYIIFLYYTSTKHFHTHNLGDKNAFKKSLDFFTKTSAIICNKVAHFFACTMGIFLNAPIDQTKKFSSHFVQEIKVQYLFKIIHRNAVFAQDILPY
jgi:hypothetical protein